MTSKYQPLADYLKALSADQVQLSFAEIEEVLGGELPDVAYSSPAFWANSKTADTHTWAHLWQLAGWQSADVDLGAKKLVFRRVTQLATRHEGGVAPLSPKQVRILAFLADAIGWVSRAAMESATGRKGFSKALGAPTAGDLTPESLEARGLVERDDTPPPFQYRITTPGRDALKQIDAAAGTLKRKTALVLTENEVYAGENFGWADKTGERYEFPNRYKKLVSPGTPFIYYRGRRRADGTAASPEYYGHGVIGEVQVSPGSETVPPSKRRWTARIASWAAFDDPVSLRAEDRTYIETRTQVVARNYWRDGVRQIDRAHYLDILLFGACSPPQKNPGLVLIEDSGPLSLASDSLIKIRSSKVSAGQDGGGTWGGPRRSKHAAVIGRAAEKLFFEKLRSTATEEDLHKLRWVSAEGSTPGYDIADHRDPNGLTAYEVKGTTGANFSALELTANEMKCAMKLGPQYSLVLVTGVGTSTPKYQILDNLSQWICSKKAVAIPSAFNLSFLSSEPDAAI